MSNLQTGRASPLATRSMYRSEKRPCTGLEEPENPDGRLNLERERSTQLPRRGRPRKSPAAQAGSAHKSPQKRRVGRPRKTIKTTDVNLEETRSSMYVGEPSPEFGKVYEKAGTGDEGRTSPTSTQQKAPNSEGICLELVVHENVVSADEGRTSPTRNQQKDPDSEGISHKNSTRTEQKVPNSEGICHEKVNENAGSGDKGCSYPTRTEQKVQNSESISQVKGSENVGAADKGCSYPTRPEQKVQNSESISQVKGSENVGAGDKGCSYPTCTEQEVPKSEERQNNLWKIRVQHGGRIVENEKGDIYYSKNRNDPADAYIHNVNTQTFRFFDLCHAILGKISGPKPQRLMWYKTVQREGLHIEEWRPIGGDADVKNMFKVSMSWTERLAMVMTQKDAVAYRVKGGVSMVKYQIPRSVPMLRHDALLSWEKMEQKIAAKEADLRMGDGKNLEHLGILQRQGKEWYVSYHSVPYEKTKVIKNGYDGGFFCDSYINKI